MEKMRSSISSSSGSTTSCGCCCMMWRCKETSSNPRPIKPESHYSTTNSTTQTKNGSSNDTADPAPPCTVPQASLIDGKDLHPPKSHNHLSRTSIISSPTTSTTFLLMILVLPDRRDWSRVLSTATILTLPHPLCWPPLLVLLALYLHSSRRRPLVQKGR